MESLFTSNTGKRVAIALLPIFLAAISLLAVNSMRLDSATFDEAVHIVSGYMKLKYGQFDYYREQPPLLDSLGALPLLSTEVKLDPNMMATNQWDFGRQFLYRFAPDPDRMLFLARLPNLILFLSLSLLVAIWIYRLTGEPYAAMAGAAMAGFCPNLLAHGRLITGDIGVTFFIVLSVFLFLRFLYRPGPLRAAATGISTGCALLSKVSGLILLPYFALLLLLFAIWERERFRGSIGAYLRDILLMAAASLLWIETVYLFLLSKHYMTSSYPHLGQTLTGRLSIPFIEYFNCISAVFHWVNGSGRLVIQQFLLGKFSVDGWWYYYPVAFLLKTPLSTLLLFLLATAVFFILAARRFKGSSSIGREQLFHLAGMLLFIVLFFAATLNNRINIGLRYILPVYPFVYLFIPVTLSCAFAAIEKRRFLAVAASLLLLFSVISGIGSYPSHIGYFNPIVPRGGEDRYLVDSNLDWGQDLKRLAIWVEENRIPAIHTLYFGGGDPSYYLGARALPFNPAAPPGRHGYYAVSRHLYRMSTNPAWSAVNLESYFRGAEHVATIGSSILVFRM